MTQKLTIVLAQGNFTVGDFAGNREKILAAHKQAQAKKAELVVFPEMAVTGYPAEDLVLRPDFQEKSTAMIRELATLTKHGTAILVGCLWREGSGSIYNAAALLDGGEIKHITSKYALPNYGVFDEKRVFAQAPLPQPVLFRGVKLGVLICEDMWNNSVAPHLKEQGAELLICMNASPFEVEKPAQRLERTLQNVRATGLPFMYVNQVGGQDELVFDGGSFTVSAEGVVFHAPLFWKEALVFTHWHMTDDKWYCSDEPQDNPPQERLLSMYRALVLGLQDYVRKNGFPGVVIGMSGGIDSALTAAIAVDALGAKRVRLVMMPSRYTSVDSLQDAEECAMLLGVPLEDITIEPAVEALASMLFPVFKGQKSDTTEENIQSRVRGLILMALSNKFGPMVLTTGNKSEMAVGYATLYGDMCGGFNVLKDIYKTDVFALSKWRNEGGRVIPENVLTKAPTAELRPNQKDEDSLPPYPVLDDILERLIERRHSVKQIAEHGYPVAVVKKVARLVKLSEYKRRQAPPGVKLTRMAFGRDRRYPITSGFEF